MSLCGIASLNDSEKYCKFDLYFWDCCWNFLAKMHVNDECRIRNSDCGTIQPMN